jgi:hypothetical protein
LNPLPPGTIGTASLAEEIEKEIVDIDVEGELL